MGAWGRRRVTAGDPARGGGALGSLEHANPAFPGSNWHGVWPRMDYAPCVVHLGSFLDLGKSRSGEGKGDDGPAHGGATPIGVLGSGRT